MGISGDALVDAYRGMRKGVLYMFIAWIVFAASIIIFIMSLFAVVFTAPRTIFAGRELGPVIAVITALLPFIVAIVAAAIIGLVGLWGKFIPGVKKLANVNPEFSTSATLIRIGLFWGLILLLIGGVLTVFLIGVLIIIVALVLILIGDIGLIILSFKLNDFEKNTLYLVAGILFIIGIFIPIASIVGWILMYIALGDSIRKRSIATPTPQTLV